MRIIHTADWHLGKNLEGFPRIEEQEQFLNDFVKIVEEEQADVVIIAGDIYDSPNPSSRAEKLFYQTLKKISHQGERITIVISGNHDNPDRLVAAGPLAMEHGIIMLGLPKTVVATGTYGRHQVTASAEGMIELQIGEESAVILCVPYPSEKRLNEVLYGEKEEDEHLEVYTDRINLLFRQLEQYYRDDTINLMTAHLFAMGSVEAGSERSIQLGGSYIIDGSLFPKQAQYIALGHVHKPQIVPGTDKRARYAGAPVHYHLKETSFANMCYSIDVHAGEEAVVREIELPVYCPIEKWKCDSVADAIAKCEEHSGENSYVYMEIKTDHYIHDDEVKEMKTKKNHIVEIMPILEQVEEETQNHSLKEKSFEEIFQAFYQSVNGVEVSDETMQELASILEGE